LSKKTGELFTTPMIILTLRPGLPPQKNGLAQFVSQIKTKGHKTMNEKDLALVVGLDGVVRQLEQLRARAAAEASTCVCGKWPQEHDPIAPCAKHAATRAGIQSAIDVLDRTMADLRKEG
jgi:hypothetical protein